MNRMTVALLAALDALIVAAIGIGIVLVPLTIVWAVQFQLSVDWGTFWRAAADVWLIGHGVNLTVVLSAAQAASLGLAQAPAPFQVTIAVLGFALLAALMGVRTGRRAAETPFRWTGAVSAIVVYGALGAIITLTAGRTPVQPSLWQGTVLPMFVFGIGVLVGEGIGAVRAREGDTAARPPRDATASNGVALRAMAAGMLRAGTAATGMIIAASAVVFTVVLAARIGSVVGLYEQLQAGVLGAVVLTIGQLALLPNAIIWCASWLVGPGFAVGAGSSVGPVGTQVGPIPALPLFGVMPAGSVAFGFLGLLVPVLAGFVAGTLMRRRMSPRVGPATGSGSLALIAIGAGCVAGIQLGLLAWWSAGAIGPGRLHVAGPNPWLVAACTAAAVAIPAIVGILTGGRRAP